MQDTEDAVEAYNRGLEYLDYNEPDQAIVAFSQAIELNGRHARAYFARGYALATKGDMAGAIADYDAAIRLDPHNGAAYFNRGAAFQQCGEATKAEADFAEARRLTTSGSKGKPAKA